MKKQPRKKAKSPSLAASGEPRLAPASPMKPEAVMRQIHRLLEGKKFESAEDANAFLARLIGDGLQDALSGDAPPDPRWQAQDLAFDAMESESAEKARELAQQALTIDPDCVDALVVMTDLDARTTR